MKLPPETLLEDALRFANQKGKWLIIGEGFPNMSDITASIANNDPMLLESMLSGVTATSDEIERTIHEDLDLLCGIKTLADLKHDFDSGNFAWRNSEAGAEICRLAYLFEFISEQQYKKAMGFK